jgi:hypothetical protein
VIGGGVYAVVKIPGVSQVPLSLHDIAGRRVSSVVADTSAPPAHGVFFPGTRDLASGVYFVRALGGGRELRERVTVIR